MQEAGQEGVAWHHLHPGCVSDVLTALKLSETKQSVECLVMAGQFHGDETRVI